MCANWHGRFSGLAARKLLDDMDANNDNVISKEEWMLYFRKVLACGDYTEKDVEDEVAINDIALQGEARESSCFHGVNRFHGCPDTACVNFGFSR